VALALFFLILIALAEHIGFALAYILASTVVVVINTLYCAAILPRRSLAVTIGAVLTAIYGILYTILKAEDFALLGGTLLLVVALTVDDVFHQGDAQGWCWWRGRLTASAADLIAPAGSRIRDRAPAFWRAFGPPVRPFPGGATFLETGDNRPSGKRPRRPTASAEMRCLRRSPGIATLCIVRN